MTGKPVMGARITVEFVLRRFAAGATQKELLADYPQLTHEEIEQALHCAANFLNLSARKPEPSHAAHKS